MLILRRRSAVSDRRTVGATFPARVLRAAIPLERWFGIKSGFAVSPTPAAPCEFRRPSHCGYFKPVFPGSRFVCYFPPPAPKGGAWALDKQRSFCGLFLRRPPWEVWATDKQNFPRKGLDKLHIACYYNNRGRRIKRRDRVFHTVRWVWSKYPY